MPIQSLHKTERRPPTPETSEHHPQRHSFRWWKLALVFGLSLVVFVGLLGYRLLAAVNTSVNGNSRLSVIAQLGHLVSKRDVEIRGEPEDRVNVLLLGIGGAGHEGPLLTDTIILASIRPSDGQVALLSIPRDLAVEIPRYGIRKINNANAFGKEMNYPGGGEQLTADIVSNITGQPIHYYARIDFAGFEQIVDDLGGISVTVERDFVDREYPTANFGYTTVRFKAGPQEMGGETALVFVRSRHGNNGEGSDFARSRRQQLVLESIRDKALSFGTLLNPVKIGNVLSSLGSHTRTNLEAWELLRLAKILRSTGHDEVISKVLESGPTGPLKNVQGQDGAFLLVPKSDSFDTIKAIARNIFTEGVFEKEQARILIFNVSGNAATGRSLATELQALGFQSPTVRSQKENQGSATAIIDYSAGEKILSIQRLESLLGIESVSSVPPLLDVREVPDILNGNNNVNASAAIPPRPEDTDIVIVLGQDYLSRGAKRKLPPVS